jgi:cell division protein FtsI (penicillin-binding protein 3)
MPRITRSSLVHGALVAFAAALVVRAAHVQLVQGREWAERARRQQYAGADLPAPRGRILDVSRVPLDESRERVSVAVAPREMRDRDRPTLARELARLGVSRSVARRAVDPRQRWVPVPGSWLPGEVAPLTGLRGVHAEPVMIRNYTMRQSTRRVVGHVNAAGKAVDGLEAALDEHLRGRAGREMVVRDARGRRSESPAVESTPAQPGDDITLTINQELQEIAERALQNAATEMGADGGDIVVLDPFSGEIRALATLRRGSVWSGSPALSEPFEPGSTLKPFVAARLLELGRARTDDVIDTENGVYTIEGRTVHDVHRAERMTFTEIIAHSSNVGIVKLASRLSVREQYEALRDLGFGTPTGVPYPSEASGLLRAPPQWTRQSAASLAMGYEISVTALQLALAYAAFANGGELLEPALVKEIRAPDGTVRYRHERRVVRRVMSERVADTMRGLLRGTVAGGSASEADVGSFEVAGKTGTARKNIGGRYVSGKYTASFVGIFPVDRPQYVILVKLDNPTSAIYGGRTAAPVSRSVIQAALAARDAALDRGALAGSMKRAPVDTALLAAEVADAAPHADTGAEVAPRPAPPAPTPSATDGSAPYVFTLPHTPRGARAPRELRTVPAVQGLAVRDAARILHQAGFRVRLVGSGTAVTTSPVAGARAAAGSLVRLTARP